MRRFAPILAIVLASAGLAAWLLHGNGAKQELALGGYIEAEQIQVGSKLAGRVLRVGMIRRDGAEPVPIDEGSEVEAGQELVVFETDEVEAQLAEARAELDRAKAKLDELNAGTREEEKQQANARVERTKEKLAMLQRGPRPQEIEQARLLVEQSKAEYVNAEAEFKRQSGLAEKSAGAKSELDAARKRMEVARRAMEADQQKHEMLKEGTRVEEIAMAKHELEEAQAALDLAIAGPRRQEKEQAEAAVEAAKARTRRLEILFQEAIVKAPLPCVVEAFDLQPGDLVAANAPLATLVRKDQLWVRVFISETDLGLVHDNQSVAVTIDSFPNQRFKGTVIRVNRIAEFTPRNVQTFKERQDMMFGIKVRVEDPQHVLRPGMAATVYVPKKS